MTDSTSSGYLLPQPTSVPLEDAAWHDFLHGVIAGITGLTPTLVRPRWQPEPPPRPDIGVDWVAFGLISTDPDFSAAVVHVDDGADGFDALQTHELTTILCSFYGPNSAAYASYLERGLYLDQNQALLRSNGVGLVEVNGPRHVPELIQERWWPRSDLEVVLRREIRLDYAVLSLLRSTGTITAQAPGETRLVEDDYDTGA